jgi:alcohol dehydrogenase (cytochrome c)
MGGANWMPSSYDPERHLMFICANDVMGGATGGDPDYPIDPDPAPNQYLGGAFTRLAAVSRGIFAAVDVRTNTIAWRQQWEDRCWAGSVATAGGLVFVGRNDGRLTALDSDTGAEVWSYQTDAGVSGTITPFERDGETYVALLAGGTYFMRSKKADSLWLFSLNGAMEQLPPGSASPAPATGIGPTLTPQPDRVADLGRGADIYGTACLPCHGQDGEGGHGGGAPLNTTALDLAGVMTVASNGRNAMPPFAAVYGRDELHDVAAYILGELKSE